MDGVFNGCQKVEISERQEDEALNCKHEMDAINHYVGMYPIAAGGPVERVLSPFVFSLLGLMIVVFVVPGRTRRTVVMTVGGLAIGAWMTASLYTEGGHKYLSPNYVTDVVTTMDLDPDEYETWSGLEMMKQGYDEALGRYFREIEVNAQSVRTMTTATHIAYGGLIVSLLILILGVGRVKAVYWLTVLMPILLPVFFIVDYAAWLWWFGHSLHEMGAFTLKPFMPTVLGQGKVAQFTTYSYPHYGYGLLAASSLVLLLAALLRRKHIRETGDDS
jgi:triacylglycerol esterase/lipase EstA (alpha/beta hydrolase family)